MAREDPQLKLRLPESLRDRIKAYAERHGRSMNTEIVRILEREFPPPLSLEARIDDLIGLIRVLKKSGASDSVIDQFTDELYELVKGIAVGRVGGVADDYRKHVRDHLSDWEIDQASEEERRYMDTMDPEELQSMWIRGNPFKNDTGE